MVAFFSALTPEPDADASRAGGAGGGGPAEGGAGGAEEGEDGVASRLQRWFKV